MITAYPALNDPSPMALLKAKLSNKQLQKLARAVEKYFTLSEVTLTGKPGKYKITFTGAKDEAKGFDTEYHEELIDVD